MADTNKDIEITYTTTLAAAEKALQRLVAYDETMATRFGDKVLDCLREVGRQKRLLASVKVKEVVGKGDKK